MMTRNALEKTHTRVKDKTSHVSGLVRKARDGSRGAFSQLIDQFHDDIFRMVFYRIRSRPDAEDITQEVFLQAFKNIAQLKTIAHFKAWLYRIAINRVRDFYRKKRFRSLVGLFSENEKMEADDFNDSDDTDSDPLKTTLRKEFWRQVEIAMERLSRMEKEVFTLRFLDHLGIKEIAETLSRSESTVKTHLYRALSKVKQNNELKNFFHQEMI
jgi:RNA polymerase sigma-70 factor (ECF subfamily)